MNEIKEILDSHDYEYLSKTAERNALFEKGLESALKDLNYSEFIKRRNQVNTKMLKIGENSELQKKYVHETHEKINKCLKTITTLFEESYWLETGDDIRMKLQHAATCLVQAGISVWNTDKRLNPEYFHYNETDKPISSDPLDDMFKHPTPQN